LSPKKKHQLDKANNHPISAYLPVFSPDFKKDLAWWYRHEPKKGDKILDLVADILNGEPFTGLGKPEALKYIATDIWSRRIDLEHRLVYKVTGNKVYFLQARYHYQSD
jgi:toxin YoeB